MFNLFNILLLLSVKFTLVINFLNLVEKDTPIYIKRI